MKVGSVVPRLMQMRLRHRQLIQERRTPPPGKRFALEILVPNLLKVLCQRIHRVDSDVLHAQAVVEVRIVFWTSIQCTHDTE